ncbi:unnamed protein product, partial [Heterosigma akashiwo]
MYPNSTRTPAPQQGSFPPNIFTKSQLDAMRTQISRFKQLNAQFENFKARRAQHAKQQVQPPP